MTTSKVRNLRISQLSYSNIVVSTLIFGLASIILGIINLIRYFIGNEIDFWFIFLQMATAICLGGTAQYFYLTELYTTKIINKSVRTFCAFVLVCAGLSVFALYQAVINNAYHGWVAIAHFVLFFPGMASMIRSDLPQK